MDGSGADNNNRPRKGLPMEKRMSNAKEIYSKAAAYYCETKIQLNPLDQARYNRSKEKERQFNENWKKEKVNLIEIVEKYAPNAKAYEKGYKLYFKGDKYTVIADLISGSARIKENATKLWLRLDGSLTKSPEGTHFKIKRWEEM